MISQKNNILQVKFNSLDLTKTAWKWSNDNLSMTITTSDYLYVGYKKQLSQFYFDLETPSTSNSLISAEKYNGTSWEEIEVFDETDGFKNSGFICVEKNHNSQKESGSDYVFIRFKVDVNTSALKFRGINLVLCSEQDLKEEEPNMERFYPRDFRSHVLSLESATKYILRKINNSGKYKYDGTDVSLISRFDLFDIEELREAAAYYTMYKIMINRADGDETDAYRLKAEEYLEKFNNAFAIFQGQRLSIDLDDSGVEDEEEIEQSTEVLRLRR